MVQAVKGLSEAQWKFKPGPTQWSVSDRSTKYQAPEQAVPKGRWPPREAIQRFIREREQTAALLSSATDLRAHSVDHPAFGPLDGDRWVLAVAAQTSRDTLQILEV